MTKEHPVRLEWKRLARRFRTPVRSAAGEFSRRESLVLRVTSAGGAGYAEVAPWPGFPGPSLDETERELVRLSESMRAGTVEVDAAFPAALPPVRAALEWARLGWGSAGISRPCAALLRDDAEAASLVAAGYATLKRKIGLRPVRDEQREVSGLVRACGEGVKLRLDANGALCARDCALWCDFLSEFPEIEWLEQPMRVGAEAEMLAAGEKAGVAERVALDESVCAVGSMPGEWPGVIAAKPLLVGDLDAWRARRMAYPQVAYASVFESPFGRQAALCVAGEDGRAGFALGFGTLGAFDDDLDAHAAGPAASTLVREPEFWDALWNRL